MIEGRVFRFGRDIDTDVIIPARYLNTSDPAELCLHVFEDIRPGFHKEAESGGIIVADENFGCGSSREHAPIALKASGIKLVIARSFARIFYRNAFNIGFPLLEGGDWISRIEEGDVLSVDLESGSIKNLTKGEEYRSKPLPGFMMEILTAGGLMEYAKKKMLGGG